MGQSEDQPSVPNVDIRQLENIAQKSTVGIFQLNHPHICTLYDVGVQDGVDFIVMEYIEGETLAERLKKGSLPLG